MGGAIKGITQSVATLGMGLGQTLQAMAPSMDLIFPGLGRLTAMGGGILKGAGAFLAGLDREADIALGQGRAMSAHGAASRSDRSAATQALQAITLSGDFHGTLQINQSTATA